MNELDHKWKAYLSGEKGAFKLLYKYCYPTLYSYGRTQIPNADIIDDAIHNVFVRIWKIKNPKIESIENYLFISFRNELWKLINNRNKRFQKHNEIEKSLTLNQDTFYEMDFQNTEETLEQKVKDILDLLPQRRREALYLKYIEGKSTKEISNIMQIREEMVRNYIYKGIKFLREHISQTVISILFLLLYFV